jgi:hypothetical protein
MELAETADGVSIDWETDADVFGRVAGMGQRVINPVANRIVKRFFSSVQDRLHDLSVEEESSSEQADESSSDDRSLVDRVLGRSKSEDAE